LIKCKSEGRISNSECRISKCFSLLRFDIRHSTFFYQSKGILPYLSNFYCHPGRAGGSPNGIRMCRGHGAGETPNAIYFFCETVLSPLQGSFHCYPTGGSLRSPPAIFFRPSGAGPLVHKHLAPEARQLVAPGEHASPGLHSGQKEPWRGERDSACKKVNGIGRDAGHYFAN